MIQRVLIGGAIVGALAIEASAQTYGVAVREEFVPAELGRQAIAGKIEAVLESKITTGRPYAADATTEFVQILGDGNRISRRTVVRIYRDGEGRTRREELGPDGQAVSISVYDPVAHTSYVLDPAARTAYKSAVRIVLPDGMAEKVRIEREAGGKVAGRIALVAPPEASTEAATVEIRKRHAEVVASGGGAGAGVLRPATRGTQIAYPPDRQAESLGEKLIEGIAAEGSRRTVQIAAATIGNERPITVTSEQWFAPELDIFVMTRHADPRTGETTYSLSNIVRGEPSPALFEVPADYTVRESSYMRHPQPY